MFNFSYIVMALPGTPPSRTMKAAAANEPMPPPIRYAFIRNLIQAYLKS
jgi:hypothetical protein